MTPLEGPRPQPVRCLGQIKTTLYYSPLVYLSLTNLPHRVKVLHMCVHIFLNLFKILTVLYILLVVAR